MRELKALHEGTVMFSEKVSLWKSHDTENCANDHMRSIFAASVDTLDVSRILHGTNSLLMTPLALGFTNGTSFWQLKRSFSFFWRLPTKQPVTFKSCCVHLSCLSSWNITKTVSCEPPMPDFVSSSWSKLSMDAQSGISRAKCGDNGTLLFSDSVTALAAKEWFTL